LKKGNVVSKKKDAIIDAYGTVVLVETIASLKLLNKFRFQLLLRSSDDVVMGYHNMVDRNEAVACIKSRFNILNKEI